MSPTTIRILGLLCIIAALVLAILNLKRVANAGTFWVAIPVLILGLVLISRSRR
ncbi:MAG TPA: hypothetical protein VGC66_15295 [Pyrinomonadaceae bacterium]|jgi:hypothetical protein